MENLFKIVSDFKKVKIAVVGDIGVDENITGVPSKFSFDAPIPVYTKEYHEKILGSAGNTMANIETLSGEVLPITFIGNSPSCKFTLEYFKERDISCDGLIVDEERPVHNYLRLYASKPHAARQQIVRYDNKILPNITPSQEDLLLEKVKNYINDIDVVIVADYSKGVVTPRVIKEISRIANDNNKILLGDSRFQVNHFNNFTVITPNDQEAIGAYRNCDPGEITESEIEKQELIQETGKSLIDRLKLENLIITRGKNGMTVFSKDTIKDFPIVARDVFDPTGAGDTSAAAVGLSLGAGANIFEAAEIANHAAGVVVGKHGTATVSVDELIQSFNK